MTMRALFALVGVVLCTSSAAPGIDSVWTAVGPVSAPVVAVRVVESVPSRVYAAIVNHGVFRSEDAGRMWSPINDGLTDLRVLNLAINPDNPSTLYASTGLELDGSPDHGGIFRSRDGGASWQKLSGSPGDAAALAVLPGAPPTVLAGYFGGVYVSTDEGTTWKQTFYYGVHTLTPVPGRPNSVFLGGLGTFESVGDVRLSTSRGLDWTLLPFPRDYTIGAIAVAPSDPSVVYAGKVSWGGVFRSRDGGASWTSASEGLSSRTVLSLAVDPRRPEFVYAGTLNGVYRSTDGGNRWTPYSEGLDDFVTALAIDPSGLRLYAGTYAGGVYARDVCDGPECEPSGSAVRVVFVSDGPSIHGGRTTTELTLLNGGTSSASVRMEFPAIPPPGSANTVTLGPGQQVTISDLWKYFRDRGLALPPTQGWDAVLRVTFDGLSASAPVAVIARTLSTGPFAPTVTGMWGVQPDPIRATLRVFGLRESESEHSEMIVLNTRRDMTANLIVRIESAAGDVTVPPTALRLGPGGFSRFQSRLPAGSSGFATIDGGGGDEFFAFGLVTDRFTESPSYMPAPAEDAEDLIAPALVETNRYDTELVFAATNQLSGFRVDAVFRDSLATDGAAQVRSVNGTSEAGMVIPHAVEWLRGQGFDLGALGGAHAGVLVASPSHGSSWDSTSRSVAATRVLTRNASGPGSYATGFLTKTERSAEGFVPGLVQDENTRSNLAIMNPGSEEIRVRWQIVDESGAPFPESEDLVLAPGEWRQFGSVLAQYGSRRGWARIRSVGGPSVSPGVFFAYAVVNDGASAGTGTGGGTYVPMNPR
jgi:photosystem II stability/assembly factor-like uncharacterized protein